MKRNKRPGFLGDQVYWFDTPAQEVVLERQARSSHSSSGAARSPRMRYIPRLQSPRKYLFDWVPFKKK